MTDESKNMIVSPIIEQMEDKITKKIDREVIKALVALANCGLSADEAISLVKGSLKDLIKIED